ncbi:competence type IV pilus minor pilin ComGF [Apilactobacillus kunkeei]|uniref:competence type IV pilus minor pilin ComGF n=1 Tax=Apilactobacillus kunkeei TaxID=148814 RepID=UPI004033FAAB
MKREKAFTIIETIIAITILGLIAFTITMINPLKKSYNRKNIHAVDFQMFLKNIESPKKHYFLYKIVGGKLLYMGSKESYKEYRIYKNGKMIILSGVNGGFYPLLDDVKSIIFKDIKNHLAMDVVFTNNESYEDVTSISYD